MMVVDVLNGFGAMVTASLVLPVLKGIYAIVWLQPGGMVAVIAVVVKAPTVVSALSVKYNPGIECTQSTVIAYNRSAEKRIVVNANSPFNLPEHIFRLRTVNQTDF